MAPKRSNPAALAGADGVRNVISWPVIASENTATLTKLQALRLARRFGLSVATAAVVAEHAFGGGSFR